MNCVHCGQLLNEDGTKHHNDIVFCAFVGPVIDWTNPHCAKKPEREQDND